MRLYTKEERDQAGQAIELIRRTILSFPPDNLEDSWDEASELLAKAQESLIKNHFYSEEFDPTLAAYWREKTIDVPTHANR